MTDKATKCAKTSTETECRACLAKICDDSFCVDLFRVWDPPWSGMGESIAEDLAKLANIQISVSDPYSKSICKKCCSRLQDAINFTWSVQNSDIELRAKHQNCIDETPWPKPIQVDKNLTSDAFNEMHVEVKQEILTEDEYEMTENCSELCEPNLDIKIEPEEITPPIAIQINGPFSLAEEPTELPKINGAAEYLDEGLLNDVKAEPTSDDETESVPGMPKDCMLCMKTFNTVKGLKAHVIAVHSYDSFTSHRVDRSNVCSTCNRSFSTRTDLFVHETCHSKFACYVCDKKFETFNLLTKHRSKQCMKTSVLPRLKTLDDVKRPVYYINDKKSPPAKSAQKKVANLSSKKPDSLVSKSTKELDSNHIKTNTKMEQLCKRNEDLRESVQLNESLSAIEETISVVEKLSNVSVEEISHSNEKISIREEKMHGIEKERPNKCTETLQPKNICITVNTPNHKSTDAENSVEQILESLHTSPQINNEAEFESNNVLKDNVTEVGDTTKGKAEVKELEKNYDEHIFEIGNIRSVVDKLETYEPIEMGSEISKETNDNQQVKLFKSNPNHVVITEDNVIKEIQQHLETCANNEPSTEQMDKKEQITEQNHSTEIEEELLLNKQVITLKDQSNNEQNMEIQLEIHSVDKEQDNAMDVDNDLEREIKMDSESDKTQ